MDTQRLALTTARNSAAHMAGSIHDDAVARRYGYRGGIVSGVALYTYLLEACDPLLPPSWFERGTVQMRFGRPLYDGDRISIERVDGGSPGGGELAVVMRREGDGDVAATFRLAAGGILPEVSAFPRVEVPAAALEPLEERYLEREHIGEVRLVPTRELVSDFLASVGVERDRWQERGWVHPAYLFRTYSPVCRENHMFQGTASIHMRSDVVHGGLVRTGEELAVRGRNRGVHSERGHRYVTFDLLWLRAGDGRPVLYDRHAAIYRRREGRRQEVAPAAV